MCNTLVIAEAGVNHNGDVTIAKKLIDVAKNAGADIVKFQTIKLDNFITKDATMAEYQKKNIGKVTSQREMLEPLQLTFDEFKELYSYCKKIGITFLSSAGEKESIEFLDPLQSIWKVSSGLVTDYPFLREIAKRRKPVLLSTGMCDLIEIKNAIDVLNAGGVKKEEITLLHCTTDYPAPLKDINLNALHLLKREFGCKIGYSDHSEGIEVSIAAVAMGARVIEKHFTLDKNMEGPDHRASLDPNELKLLVKSIRNVELALGNEEKKPSKVEIENRKVARKSIVAKTRIQKGELFTEDNLICKRPGIGLSPMEWNTVLGRKAKKNFEEDERITL